VTSQTTPPVDLVKGGDAKRDLIAARSVRLIRVGGVGPALSTILLLVGLRVAGGGASQLAVGVAAFSAVGQGLVWWGLDGLRRSKSWAVGVGTPLIAGALISAQTLFLTGIPALMPVPLVAPAVWLFAKWRFERREHTGMQQ
jgi:hypothetical protein